MKSSLQRRIAAIEAALPAPEPGLTVAEEVALLEALSDAQLDILEALIERRDAWPGDLDDWMANDLSITDRQHLFEITTTLDVAARRHVPT